MTLDLKPPSPVKTHVQDVSLKDKLTSRWNWLHHLTRAYDQYNNQFGPYFAAGMTFRIFMALFPLVMVAFGIAGALLQGHADVMQTIQNNIASWLSKNTHIEQIQSIMNNIVARSHTVGIFGGIAALWGGIGFISGLREALTNQWGADKIQQNFFIRKLQDFLVLMGMYIILTLIVGVFVVYTVAQDNLWGTISHRYHILTAPIYVHLLRALSLVVRYILIFFMWTYVIAKLPRIQLPFRYAWKSGLLMTFMFAVLLRVFTFLIMTLENNPVLGVAVSVFALMTFFNWTSRLLLYSTAWAATSEENQPFNNFPKAPAGVVIQPCIESASPARTSTRVMLGSIMLGSILTFLGLRKTRKRPDMK